MKDFIFFVKNIDGVPHNDELQKEIINSHRTDFRVRNLLNSKQIGKNILCEAGWRNYCNHANRFEHYLAVGKLRGKAAVVKLFSPITFTDNGRSYTFDHAVVDYSNGLLDIRLYIAPSVACHTFNNRSAKLDWSVEERVKNRAQQEFSQISTVKVILPLTWYSKAFDFIRYELNGRKNVKNYRTLSSEDSQPTYQELCNLFDKNGLLDKFPETRRALKGGTLPVYYYRLPTEKEFGGILIYCCASDEFGHFENFLIDFQT